MRDCDTLEQDFTFRENLMSQLSKSDISLSSSLIEALRVRATALKRLFFSRKIIALSAIFLALVFAATLLLDRHYFGKSIENFVGLEPFKTLLQFSLITALGGSIFIFMSIIKDEEIARQNNNNYISERIRDLDRLYRETKKIKRCLRSRSQQSGDIKIIDKDYFEKMLDEINDVQIDLEQLKILINFSDNKFFNNATKDLIDRAMRYSSRYFHDVFEDFEKKKVEFYDGKYRITNSCENICDFLSSKEPPNNIRDDAMIVKLSTNSMEARWAAFSRIDESRQRGGRRYRIIAEECVSLVIFEMRKI